LKNCRDSNKIFYFCPKLLKMKKAVLFVCLGNICRSPGAEAIFKSMVKKERLDKEISCESAGIISAHEGEPADARMQKHAAMRGFKLEGVARKFDPKTDFDRFDYIIAMDEDNESDLQRMTRNTADSEKIYRMTDFASSEKFPGVPDPYYGGNSGFELVLDLLEDSCEGLIEHLRNKI
jgi:protein-tyrosine phosphatase